MIPMCDRVRANLQIVSIRLLCPECGEQLEHDGYTEFGEVVGPPERMTCECGQRCDVPHEVLDEVYRERRLVYSDWR
jgi:hypothetical protein